MEKRKTKKSSRRQGLNLFFEKIGLCTLLLWILKCQIFFLLNQLNIHYRLRVPYH